MSEIIYHKTFLKDKARLTRDEQRAFLHLEADIRCDYPLTPGKNRELLKCHSGEHIYSFRVNDDIRLAAWQCNKGEYIFLAVGHHQELYTRIERMELKRHGEAKIPDPEIVDVTQEVDMPRLCVVPGGDGEARMNLRKLSDDDIASIGISRDMIYKLRGSKSDDEILDVIAELESQRLKDALIDLLIEPTSLNQIRIALQKKPVAAEMPLRNLAKTLQTSVADRENYFMLTDDLMERFGNGQLEDWQVFLHPDQTRAIEMNAAGPMMVKGPAGTGKTVVVVHRAKWLLENIFKNGERVLVTTFNKSLESVIHGMLEKICSRELLERIDVIYFDRLLGDLWKQIGGVRIEYDKAADEYSHLSTMMAVLRRDYQELFKDTKRTDAFLCEEYDRVVEEFRIETEQGYLDVVRPKTRPVVRREERRALWRIFSVMHALQSRIDGMHKTCSRNHAMNRIATAITCGIVRTRHSAIIVDESQDMGATEYRLLAAMTGNAFAKPMPNSLFFAGDGNQRIYGRSGALKDCGINVHARSIKLRKCYRSSKAIKRFAEAFLPSSMPLDMDGEREESMDGEAIIDGVAPQMRFFKGEDSYGDMCSHIVNTIKSWMSEAGTGHYSDYAVLLREGASYGKFGYRKTGKLEQCKKQLEALGLPAVVISAQNGRGEGDAVKIMTMHRAKGMQFVGVVIVADGWPHELREADGEFDEEAHEEALNDEKRLMYMAIMRALKYVVITGRMAKTEECIHSLRKAIPTKSNEHGQPLGKYRVVIEKLNRYLRSGTINPYAIRKTVETLIEGANEGDKDCLGQLKVVAESRKIFNCLNGKCLVELQRLFKSKEK